MKLVLDGSFVLIVPVQMMIAYMGAVNDDIIQNPIPIATNTILIISISLDHSVGNTPGWSRDFTLIYYTRICNKILKWTWLERYPFRLPC